MGELSGSLLQVLTYRRDKGDREGAIPLMMEFPVNPLLAPILVSSSEATLWISPKRGVIRAALRESENLPDFFWEVTQAVIKEGRAKGWGNVHKLTVKGIQDAIDHVKSYELSDLEILANPQIPWGRISKKWAVVDGEIPMALLGLPIQPATWLPKHTVLIVPRDREFVGFVLLFQERIVAVIHNAPRGIGVATSRG